MAIGALRMLVTSGLQRSCFVIELRQAGNEVHVELSSSIIITITMIISTLSSPRLLRTEGGREGGLAASAKKITLTVNFCCRYDWRWRLALNMNDIETISEDPKYYWTQLKFKIRLRNPSHLEYLLAGVHPDLWRSEILFVMFVMGKVCTVSGSNTIIEL